MHAALRPTACALTCVSVLVIHASGDAAGGEQGSSSTAKALEDCTPQQVGGGGSKGYDCHMMAQNSVFALG
jgi:hypothetical protein